MSSEILQMCACLCMLSRVIRLGEVGAGSFHQQVEDEDARADFELSSGNSRAFKIFSKQLSTVQKLNAASSKRTSSSKRSRNRSATSSSRGRRSSRRPRSGNRRRNSSRYRSRSRERNRGSQTPPRRPASHPQKSGSQNNQSWVDSGLGAVPSGRLTNPEESRKCNKSFAADISLDVPPPLIPGSNSDDSEDEDSSIESSS